MGFRINQYRGNAAATAKLEAHLGNFNSLTEDLTASFTAKNIALAGILLNSGPAIPSKLHSCGMFCM